MTNLTATQIAAEIEIVAAALAAYHAAEDALSAAREAECDAENDYNATLDTYSDLNDFFASPDCEQARNNLVAAWHAGDVAKDSAIEAWQDYANAAVYYPEAAAIVGMNR